MGKELQDAPQFRLLGAAWFKIKQNVANHENNAIGKKVRLDARQ
jgi:hypothetical protein